MFQSDYWQLPQVEALLTSVPQGSMMILDLYSTHEEQYTRTNSYFGQPFIFNDLSNFGGNPGFFGHIENVNKGPFQARLPINGKNSSMVGTGYTMEGLDLTYPTVDLVNQFFLQMRGKFSYVNLKLHLSDINKNDFQQY